MSKLALIILDPLLGFCEPSGSLGQKYGRSELAEIQETIPRIRRAVEESERIHLVKSEYAKGKFTEGDLTDELSHLCVPTANQDCDVIRELSDIGFDTVSIKNEHSALSSNAFVDAIRQDIDSGIQGFVIAGFLLEHCVRTTAIDLRQYITNQCVRVVVCSNLSGSRVEKYRTGQVEKVFDELRQAGVEIDVWENLSNICNSRTDMFDAV